MASGMYDLDDSKQKVQLLKQLLHVQLEIDTLKDLLDKHGIINSLEFDAAMNYRSKLPEYAQMAAMIQQMEATIQHYKDDPRAYLQDLMKAKMQGKG